jgi:hypothetical protein
MQESEGNPRSPIDPLRVVRRPTVISDHDLIGGVWSNKVHLIRAGRGNVPRVCNPSPGRIPARSPSVEKASARRANRRDIQCTEIQDPEESRIHAAIQNPVVARMPAWHYCVAIEGHLPHFISVDVRNSDTIESRSACVVSRAPRRAAGRNRLRQPVGVPPHPDHRR